MKRLLISLLLVVIFAASVGAAPVFAQTATCGATVTVQRGDYLSKIARTCGITVSALLAANPQITNANRIYPGQVLKIPAPGSTPVPVTGGSIYIVKPGDTLSAIARYFGVSLDAVLKANPSITNANRIEKGQRITLPSGALQKPTVSIAPESGKAGAVITLGAVGFRPSINVEILFGLSESQLESIGNVTTDARGALLQQVTVPSSAQSGKAYIFVVRSTQNSNERASSNIFTVGGTPQTTPIPTSGTYTVQRGDQLRAIAVKFNTSVAALLKANPSISNPNLIYPGQVINLSATSGAVVAIAPSGGSASTKVIVWAGGYPANQDVDIEIVHPNGSIVQVLDDGSDHRGELDGSFTIPAGAKAGEQYTVRVRTTEAASPVSASAVFTVR